MAEPITSRGVLEHVSLDLLRPEFPPKLGVRLLGVTVSNLDALPQTEGAQLLLPLGYRDGSD